MPDIPLGICVFACCNKPHVVFAARGNDAEAAEADFAQALISMQSVMGEALKTMFVTMPGEQFIEIEIGYHGLDTHVLEAAEPATGTFQ